MVKSQTHGQFPRNCCLTANGGQMTIDFSHISCSQDSKSSDKMMAAVKAVVEGTLTIVVSLSSSRPSLAIKLHYECYTIDIKVIFVSVDCGGMRKVSIEIVSSEFWESESIDNVKSLTSNVLSL
jgi:hypothetical protein